MLFLYIFTLSHPNLCISFIFPACCDSHHHQKRLTYVLLFLLTFFSSSSLDFGSSQELHLLGLGQSLVVFKVIFLVVSLPSIVLSRLGFQDMVFGDLTSIARGRLHDLMISFCLPFHICSLISLQLSSLLESL